MGGAGAKAHHRQQRFFFRIIPLGVERQNTPVLSCLLNPDAAQASRNLKSYKGGLGICNGEFESQKDNVPVGVGTKLLK